MQEKPPLKHRLACQLVRLTRILSFKSAWRFSGWLARVLFHTKSDLKSTLVSNLKSAFPEYSPQAQQQLAQLAFRHTLAFALEAGSVWLRPLEYGIDHITSIEGLELLNEALASGQGVIMILPHLGNWEMANQFIAPRTKVVALYKPQLNKELEHYIFAARTRAGVTMVPANRTGVSQILRHLKAGGVTVILPDQVPETNGGVIAPFFGRPAATSTLVPKLAKSSGARLLGLVCARDDQGQFKVQISTAPADIANTDIQLATTSMNTYIESLVQQYPAQYQWSYKRFKKVPVLHSAHSTETSH